MIIKNIRILWRWLVRQGFPCLFHSMTGLYCPGCGGTRAVWYLFQGNFIKSFQYHPFVVYVAAVTMIWTIRKILFGRKTNTGLRKSRYLWRSDLVIWVGMGIILVNWAVKNWALIVMGIDLLP